MSQNGTPGEVYRFMELTGQHQIALLRQEILRLEQVLYAISLQEQEADARRRLVLEGLQRARGTVQRLVAPAQEQEPADQAEAPELPAEAQGAREEPAP